MEIPFEPQRDQEGDRRCGAACLAMAYRSLGIPITQEEAWEAIARSDNSGSRRTARSFRLAADGLRRGLDACVLRVAQPVAWIALMAREPGLRVILNHRAHAASSQGHFSLLIGTTHEGAVLHDPRTGPCQAMPRDALLECWTPTPPPCEITGRIAIALKWPEKEAVLPCRVCGRSLPSAVVCGRCKHPIRLRPHAALGCGHSCSGRHWETLFCTTCDAGISSLAAGAD